MDRTSNFLIDFPRLAVEVQSGISSPTTLTWWYLASINILNENACILLDSTIRCCCHYLMNLSTPQINDWMLQGRKN
jgi:hypothetical protein